MLKTQTRQIVSLFEDNKRDKRKNEEIKELTDEIDDLNEQIEDLIEDIRLKS